MRRAARPAHSVSAQASMDHVLLCRRHPAALPSGPSTHEIHNPVRAAVRGVDPRRDGRYTRSSWRPRRARHGLFLAAVSEACVQRGKVEEKGEKGEKGEKLSVQGGCAREGKRQRRSCRTSDIRTESDIPRCVRVPKYALSIPPPRSGLFHRTWSSSSCSLAPGARAPSRRSSRAPGRSQVRLRHPLAWRR